MWRTRGIGEKRRAYITSAVVRSPERCAEILPSWMVFDHGATGLGQALKGDSLKRFFAYRVLTLVES